MAKDITFNEVQNAVLSEIGENNIYTELLRRVDTLEPTAITELVAIIIKVVREVSESDDKNLDIIARKIYENNYGLGAITELYNDMSVSEIWVNDFDNIWFERNGLRERYNGLSFQSRADVRRVIDLMNRFDKKEISSTDPIKEAKLADGSRLTSIIPPVSDHPIFNLRCPNSFVPTTENMLKTVTMSKDLSDLLTVLVRGRSNILVIGETGAGKTQLIRWLIGHVRRDLHVVTMETRQELFLDKLYDDLSVASLEECLEHNIGHDELFRVSLRMTPSIIVCGEMRSYEAEWVIHAMRRGHPGSISSLHTTSPEFVVDDIAEMICKDGKAREPKQLTQYIANAIDIVVQINRSDKTGKRQITRVAELVKDDNTRLADIPYDINNLYYYSDDNNSFIRAGQIRSLVLKQKILQYAPETPERYFYSF
jgi:pilus assembly protein CpaF